PHDPPVAEADVRLHDAPVVDDDRVGDDDVQRAARARGPRRLAHAVSDHLAAAELGLLARHRQVALDPAEQLCIRKADPTADRRPIQLGVLTPAHPQRHARSPSPSRASAASRPRPLLSPFSPKTWRAPASSTKATRFSSPGSNRTAVPAGIFSRIPNACP